MSKFLEEQLETSVNHLNILSPNDINNFNKKVNMCHRYKLYISKYYECISYFEK